ncbi:MAG: DUF1631 family protein [Marinagarivorans sp.]|nr:DUF1631 family protein [Marinagarivorans sp.]
MKPISIYRNLLLPDITDFCQNFFPSLVEHSYDENKEPPHAQQQDKINSCTSLFMLWLKNSLCFDDTPINTDIYFSLKNKTDIDEVERLNQYLTYATANKIDSHNNPLAPHNIISALAYYVQATHHNKTIQLVEHLQNQFNEVAFGFYKKLNSLCDNYFKDVLDNNELENHVKPARPSTNLDDPISENTHPKVKNSAPSIAEAESIIDEIKKLFKQSLAEENLHPSIYRATKKLYLPLINYAISASPHTSADISTSVKDTITCLAQFTPAITHYQSVQVQQIIHGFIQQTLSQTAELNTLLLQLLALTDFDTPRINIPDQELLIAQTIVEQKTKAAIQNQAPIKDLASSENQVSTETQNTEFLLRDSQSPSYPLTIPSSEPKILASLPKISALLPKKSSHSAREYAQDAIAVKLKNGDQSVAHQLSDDWTSVLILTGSIHGVHSAQWQNAIETFDQLTQFATFKDLPLPLLYKIEAQLQFAGVSTVELKLSSATTGALETTELANIKEGAWFEYHASDERITRCKLAAIIKQIGLYIFVTKHGKKILEIQQEKLQAYLDKGTLIPLQKDSVSNTLEDVLRNIKHAQNSELEKSYD